MYRVIFKVERRIWMLDWKRMIKLKLAKRRFPDSLVESHLIGNHVYLGRDCYIGGGATIRDGASIGEQCVVEGGVFIGENARIGSSVRLYRNVTIDPGVSIGDHSYVTVNGYIFSGEVGKYCSIGPYCMIGMPEHPLSYVSTSPAIYGPENIFRVAPSWNDFAKPPQVGNDVWIGVNATILQGVKVGDGAVIAAGSVVVKDVPPYTIVAGVPAKVIKRRFDEDQIAYLQSLRWWDLPEAELKNYRQLLTAKEDWFQYA
jgi:virginiamycin A acetyltransferase